MAINTRNPLRVIVDEAVSATQAAQRRGGSPLPTLPALEATRAATNDEGHTVTQFPFTLGVDALGDKNAVLSVRGRKRQYYRS